MGRTQLTGVEFPGQSIESSGIELGFSDCPTAGALSFIIQVLLIFLGYLVN